MSSYILSITYGGCTIDNLFAGQAARIIRTASCGKAFHEIREYQLAFEREATEVRRLAAELQLPYAANSGRMRQSSVNQEKAFLLLIVENSNRDSGSCVEHSDRAVVNQYEGECAVHIITIFHFDLLVWF